MIKQTINIGDVFHTWKVTSKESGKYIYKYKCTCVKCNTEKIISKYSLLKRTYALCEKCGVENILESNLNSLKLYWNYDLNPPLTPNNLNTLTPYWFICNKGHNFKKTIKDFTPEECPTCKRNASKLCLDTVGNKATSSQEGKYTFADRYAHLLPYWDYRKNKDNPNSLILSNTRKKYWFICKNGHEFNRTLSHIIKGKWCPHCDRVLLEGRISLICRNLFSAMFDNVLYQEEFPIELMIREQPVIVYPDLVIEDLKLAILFYSSQRCNFDKSVHNTEDDFLFQIEKDAKLKEWLISNNYEIKIFNLSNNFDEDIDNLKNFVVKFI